MDTTCQGSLFKGIEPTFQLYIPFKPRHTLILLPLALTAAPLSRSEVPLPHARASATAIAAGTILAPVVPSAVHGATLRVAHLERHFNSLERAQKVGVKLTTPLFLRVRGDEICPKRRFWHYGDIKQHRQTMGSLSEPLAQTSI